MGKNNDLSDVDYTQYVQELMDTEPMDYIDPDL